MRVFRALMAVAALATGAQGQDRPTISDLKIGWGESIVSDRFLPIRATLTGGKPFSGALVITYVQDPSQEITIAVPASVTPGLPTTIEVAGVVPIGLRSMKVELKDGGGRTVHSREPGVDSVLAPQSWSMSATAICVGRTNLPRLWNEWVSTTMISTWERSDLPADDLSWRRWARVAFVQVPVSSLSQTWATYDSALAVVVGQVSDDPRDGGMPEPRALDALRMWVEQGGSLVVLADGAPARWAHWVPGGKSFVDDILTFRSAMVEPPQSVLDAARDADANRKAREAAAGADNKRFGSNMPTPANPSSDAPTATDAPAANEIPPATGLALKPPTQVMTLTAAGKARGWSLRWPVEGGGLIAHGPVGFGRVTIIGLNPRDAAMAAPGSTANEAARAVWKDALSVAFMPWLTREADPTMHFWGGMASSGATQTERAAIAGTLSSVTKIRRIPIGVAVAIGGAVLVLAVVLAVVDPLLMRRFRITRHSWLSAIGWIALASGAAYLAPIPFRSGDTSIGRYSTIDLIAGETSSEGFATTLTGISSGRPQTLSLTPSTSPSALTWPADLHRAAWTRGVSPLADHAGKPFGSGLKLVPESLILHGRHARGGPIHDVEMGQWTVRALLARGPAKLPVTATLTRSEDTMDVRVSGLPEFAVVRFARVFSHDKLWHFVLDRTAPGVLSGSATAQPLSAQARLQEGDDLPGVPSIDPLIESGSWGVLILTLDGLPSDLETDATVVRKATLRIAAPISTP